jgi:hypothetical protein
VECLKSENLVTSIAFIIKADNEGMKFSEVLFQAKKAHAVKLKEKYLHIDLAEGREKYLKMFELFGVQNKSLEEQKVFKIKYAPFEPRRSEPVLLQPVDMRYRNVFTTEEQRRIMVENRQEMLMWLRREREHTTSKHD